MDASRMRADRVAVEHIGERRGRIGVADSPKGEAYWRCGHVSRHVPTR